MAKRNVKPKPKKTKVVVDTGRKISETGAVNPSEPNWRPYVPPTEPAAGPPTIARNLRGIRGLGMAGRRGIKFNKLMGTTGKVGLAGLAGLGSVAILKYLLNDPSNTNEIEQSVKNAEIQARSQKIAALLKQSREEQSLNENQKRLAQSAPDLYTSVMAGQRVPKGSVVLGGRPREDLMRQLAASMDSGRYKQQDPLSDLMG